MKLQSADSKFFVRSTKSPWTLLLRSFVLLLLMFMALQHEAQVTKCPKIPEKYEWKTPSSFDKDKELVKRILRWLCSAPPSVDPEDHMRANAFVLEWLAGSPKVTVEIETRYLRFYESQPDMLFTFIHGVALSRLERPDITDKEALYLKGYEAVATVASQSKTLSSDPILKEIIKAHRKKKLNKYVHEIFLTGTK